MTAYGNTAPAGRIRKKLADWYVLNHRRLPWRETRDPYRIWVSEVMLQQTRVRTVVPYYLRFMDRFPDVAALAGADLQEVLKLWEGLGYYGRARHLHQAAGSVLNANGGRIPDSYEKIKTLQGVGEYIASAVASIAFGLPHAVVDGNVKRVLARLFEIPDPVNLPASHKVFRHAAGKLLDRRDPGTFNQALMELGALVCTPRNARCGECPVRRFCSAADSGATGKYPTRVSRAKIPHYRIAAGVVLKNGKMLITLRKPEGLLGGLWEFPGGKVKSGESAEAACVREIAEETGLTVRVENHLCRVRHAYTHFKITMEVFTCRWKSGSVRLGSPVDFRWIMPGQIDDYPFPGANRKFIPLLLRQLTNNG